MKRIATVGFILVLAFALASPTLAAVTISQVYGGGGAGTSTGPTYQRDYIELLNVSDTAVNIGGWLLAYTSAAGSFSTTNTFTLPAGLTIPPCHYFLIVCGSTGAGGVPVPGGDYVFPTSGGVGPNMSATAGKIALLSAGPAGTAICPGGTVVDFVGYGPTASCAEGSPMPPGSPTPVLTNTTAAFRKGGGTQDTNNNFNDFTVTVGVTNPRNSSVISPECIQVPTLDATWGGVKALYR